METKEVRSTKIAEWLESHSEFSINGMCKKLGVNSGNFYKYIRLRQIPETVLGGVEEFLANYGFGKVSIPTLERQESDVFVTGKKVVVSQLTPDSGKNRSIDTTGGLIPPPDLKGIDLTIWKRENGIK